MSAFVIVDTKITDAEAYERYKSLARPMAEKHGGVYRARGGGMVVVDSDLWTPTRLVVIEFPSMAAAQGFVDDPDYAPIKAIRHAAAESTLTIVEGF